MNINQTTFLKFLLILYWFSLCPIPVHKEWEVRLGKAQAELHFQPLNVGQQWANSTMVLPLWSRISKELNVNCCVAVWNVDVIWSNARSMCTFSQSRPIFRNLSMVTIFAFAKFDITELSKSPSKHKWSLIVLHQWRLIASQGPRQIFLGREVFELVYYLVQQSTYYVNKYSPN